MKMHNTLQMIIFSLILLLMTLSCGKDNSPAGSQSTIGVTIEEYLTRTDRNIVAGEDSETVIADYTDYNTCAISLHKNSRPLNSLDPSNHVVGAGSFFSTIAMVSLGAAGETSAWLAGFYPFLDGEKLAFDPCFPDNPSIVCSHAAMGQSGYRFEEIFLQKLDKQTHPALSAHDLRKNWVTESAGIFSMLGITLDCEAICGMTRLVIGSKSSIDVATESVFHVAERFNGLFEIFEGIQYRKPHVRIQGEYGYVTTGNFTAYDTSSDNGSLSMLFIFPSSREAFQSLEENLDESVSTILASLQKTEVSFSVPEFSIESWYGLSVAELLEPADQDFSGVNGLGFLFLKSVFVSTSLDLNSLSISATGKSGAIFDATSDEPDTVWDDPNGNGSVIITTGRGIYEKEGIKDSSPFLFIIRDKKTGAILFSGNLFWPGGEEAGSWNDGIPDEQYDEMVVQIISGGISI